ncbi:MAG: leucine-rich repeat domain-containing protein [Lachnospiraceae bacterium]|nr:leucine-rich repeat domain-containing protein [Lachnospiraceae bacterium]
MNKKLLPLIPVLAAALVLLIGGIYYAKASTDGDFNVTGGVLHSYNGTDKKVTVPSTVQTVGREAFMGNPYIEEVNFSGSVTKIDESAFKDCKALKSVVIPDNIASVGDSAFWGCSSLGSVKIGAGLKNFGNGAFSDCDSLQYISVSSENPYLTSEGSAVFNKSKSKIYQFAAGSLTQSYGIPENVTDLARYAFWGCDNLKNITVNGMKKIPDHAFSNCTGLINVTMQIPTSEIGIRAFSGCTNLLQVIIPESVGKIHETAFEGCPDNLCFVCDTYSYAYRYADENFRPVSNYPMINVRYVTGADEDSVYIVANDGTVLVSENGGAEAALTRTEGNNDAAVQGSTEGQGSAVAQDSAVNTPGSSDAAEEHNSLRVTVDGVVLGNSPVVSDRAYVQVDSSDYTVVDPNTIPVQSSNTIADHAHYLDQTLTEFYFEPGLKEIGDFAFARTHLTSVNLPEGITSVGEGAFYHCDMLNSVYIPSSVKYVGKNAFNFTPWYNSWMENAEAGDLLIVGDGVLIGVKGELPETLPANIKSIAEGVVPE